MTVVWRVIRIDKAEMGKVEVGMEASVAVVACAVATVVVGRRVKSRRKWRREVGVFRELEEACDTTVGRLKQMDDAMAVEKHTGLASKRGSKLQKLLTFVDNLPQWVLKDGSLNGAAVFGVPVKATIKEVIKPELLKKGFELVNRKDISPIVKSCSFYTCQNHTKAYIHHLLKVHEMLVQILLEIDNTHHYLRFFRAIREAIKEGKFEQFRQKFVEKRECRPVKIL